MLASKHIRELEMKADDYSQKARRLYEALESMPGGKERMTIPLSERIRDFNFVYSYPKGPARQMLILDRVAHGMYCEAERLRYFAARVRRQEEFAPHFGRTAIVFVAAAYILGVRSLQHLAAVAVVSVLFSYLLAMWVLMQHMINLYVSVTATQELRSSGMSDPLWPATFMCRAGIEALLSGETDNAPHLADIEFDWRETIEEALKEQCQTHRDTTGF